MVQAEWQQKWLCARVQVQQAACNVSVTTDTAQFASFWDVGDQDNPVSQNHVEAFVDTLHPGPRLQHRGAGPLKAADKVLAQE